jgi:hypothetical protein
MDDSEDEVVVEEVAIFAVAVVSSSEDEEPFEEVEEFNGLPLLGRLIFDGKSAFRLDLIISASIALVGVEKRAV